VRRTIVLSMFLALFGVAPFASAAGTNLSWDDCGAFGQMQHDFACDTNSGVSLLYASVVTGVAMPQLNGVACRFLLQTDQAALSPWWHFETNGCRGPTFSSPTTAGLLASADFTSQPTSCLDPWSGGAAGGMNYTPGGTLGLGPNRGLIRAVSAIPGNTSIDATSEYVVIRLTFRHIDTVGSGSCAGCSESACILLSEMQLTQPLGVGDVRFGDSQPAQRNWVRWHSGIVSGGCPAALPARQASWGAVKSLYR